MATTSTGAAMRDARPLDWGSTREMNGVEALMWRAERDPRLRSTICALEELDNTPAWERILAAHDWATRLVPRFRQRVVESALGLGVPTWANDPDFDLHYHVRRVRLADGSGFAELLDAAEQIAMTPLDRVRPLWEGVLFEGLPDGRSAYLFKLHHSMTDGLGGVQLLSELLSRQREPSPDKPQVPRPGPERASGSRALVKQVLRGATGLPWCAASGAGAALRALADPLHAGRDALRFGRSLQRVLADPDAPGSPLLRGRSLSSRWAALDVAFAELRAAGNAAGGSLNDAFLASLLGGFRRYHEELGASIERMRVAVPVSVRRVDDAPGGNRIAGSRLAAPVGIADPADRIVAVGELVRRARDEPALNAFGLIAPGLARLPAPLISRLAGGLTKSNDLQASNVTGLREEVFFAGARIDRVYPFGPLPGCASMITLQSWGETCCIGVNLDPAAITEPPRFARCLADGFDEVLALADPGAHAAVRT
jgi:diacylglycerol O-acyltransferase / wax synthase